MKTQAGVWIDHRKAVIVAMTDIGEEIRLLISSVEKQLRRAGDSPLQGPYEAQQVPADDSRERKHTGQLNIYYDAVIASIREADSLLIFGPGEAKGELAKRLERSHFSGRIVGSETADKMTHRQIAAKVRQYFHAKSSRQKERERITSPRSADDGAPRVVPSSCREVLSPKCFGNHEERPPVGPEASPPGARSLG